MISFIKKIIKFYYRVFNPLPKSRREALTAWFGKNGDRTLRMEYPLTKKSIVFDLGGYQGQWACDIYVKYGCKVYVFEPSQIFFKKIAERVSPNDDFRLFNFGLASNTATVKLYQQKDGSSIYKVGNGNFELMELKKASDFLKQENISNIDLIKINIEGAEYDLLEHLIDTGWINSIDNIQVQFHDFVPDAVIKMKTIQEKLGKTHSLTYQYLFVWENWKKK